MATALAAKPVDVSVLVPAKDEAGNLALFMQECAETFGRTAETYEVVVIDDGSTDNSWPLLQELKKQYSFLKPVRHRARRGIAEALRTGYHNSEGDTLVFYPADLQFKPEDIPRLVQPILHGDSDMVTGYKEGKYNKAFVSGIYNKLSRSLFDVPVRDLNNVKAYRREVMQSLPMRPDWHRYMIVLAHASGYSVSEVPMPLYPRHSGASKFGLSRIPIGVLDMLSVWFELRFGQKPLLAFGMLGAGLFALGFLVGIVAVAVRLFGGIGYRPLLTLVETLMLLGSVFFATGLMSEQIAQQRAEVRESRRELETLGDLMSEQVAQQRAELRELRREVGTLSNRSAVRGDALGESPPEDER